MHTSSDAKQASISMCVCVCGGGGVLQTGWLSARALSSGNEGVGGGCCTLILALLVGTVHTGWSCRSTGCDLSGLRVTNSVVGRVCKGVGGGVALSHFRVLCGLGWIESTEGNKNNKRNDNKRTNN
jgi:hypothetical protein